jgi:hypothetical protein
MVAEIRTEYQIFHVHAMKEYGGVEVQLHPSLISKHDGNEWSVPCSGGKKAPVPTERS